MKDKLGVFLIGGAIGATIALLCAPRTGVETRAVVADRLNTAWNGAQDFGANAAAQTQQVYQNVSARGQEFAQNAGARVQDFTQVAGARVQDFAQTASTRGQEFAQTAGARAQEFAQTAATRGQEFAQTVGARGQEFAQGAAARVQQAAGNVKAAGASLNGDELREKIEAARQRIASQVVKNAEESHETVADTIDVDAAVADVAEPGTPQA